MTSQASTVVLFAAGVLAACGKSQHGGEQAVSTGSGASSGATVGSGETSSGGAGGASGGTTGATGVSVGGGSQVSGGRGGASDDGSGAGGADAGQAGAGGAVADGGAAAVAHGFCWNLDPDAERQREICAGVQQLELSNVAVNAGGDEQVSPGERASINVSLTNTGSMPVSLPCVGLVADVPVSSSGDNPLNSFFSIAPGQTLPHPAPDVEFDEGSAVGTVIEFTVYAAAVGADCTEADNLSFSITLE